MAATKQASKCLLLFEKCVQVNVFLICVHIQTLTGIEGYAKSQLIVAKSACITENGIEGYAKSQLIVAKSACITEKCSACI